MSLSELKFVLYVYLTNVPRIKAAATWFEWHNDALSRIAQLRYSRASDARQVKIAILDSGIELSQDAEDMYDCEPRIRYKSFLDQDTKWKDEVGHGTHLAILLRKIAPNAVVHVGRVFKKEPTEGSANNIAEVKIPELRLFSRLTTSRLFVTLWMNGKSIS